MAKERQKWGKEEEEGGADVVVVEREARIVAGGCMCAIMLHMMPIFATSPPQKFIEIQTNLKVAAYKRCCGSFRWLPDWYCTLRASFPARWHEQIATNNASRRVLK